MMLKGGGGGGAGKVRALCTIVSVVNGPVLTVTVKPH